MRKYFRSFLQEITYFLQVVSKDLTHILPLEVCLYDILLILNKKNTELIVLQVNHNE